MKKTRISVVVPAWNEEQNVVPVYEAVSGVFARDLPEYDLEMVFVDDGSTDDTWTKLKEIAARDDRVKALSLSRNFGHQAALTAGLHEATGDAVITMDADFQDPPDLIPQMVHKWKQGNAIVYGRRVSRSDPFFKKWTATLYYRLISRFSEVEIPPDVGDFRLISRDVLRNFLQLNEHARYLRGMIAWLGFKHDFVDFERPDRLHGKTHYSLGRMMKLAMDGILNFTFLPLRVGLWVGLLTVLVSIAFLIYMFVDTLLHWEIRSYYPLYKWLIVILFGFMGVQFMFLWILGEYISRIYNDVRRRPLYLVAERVNCKAP
ncbi:MAG: glycosyltransferase family 2 protein [Kiritimatiellae bacterium]|nr:glycosyltransferase family 2 protein [Kiritimatiellia bacterium]